MTFNIQIDVSLSTPRVSTVEVLAGNHTKLQDTINIKPSNGTRHCGSRMLKVHCVISEPNSRYLGC